MTISKIHFNIKAMKYTVGAIKNKDCIYILKKHLLEPENAVDTIRTVEDAGPYKHICPET